MLSQSPLSNQSVHQLVRPLALNSLDLSSVTKNWKVKRETEEEASRLGGSKSRSSLGESEFRSSSGRFGEQGRYWTSVSIRRWSAPYMSLPAPTMPSTLCNWCMLQPMSARGSTSTHPVYGVDVCAGYTDTQTYASERDFSLQ